MTQSPTVENVVAEPDDEILSPEDSARDLIERFRSGDCPFCGRDPYHYVHNGIGLERVAIVCCDLGIALFQDGDEQLARAEGERHQAAHALSGLLDKLEAAEARVTALEAEKAGLAKLADGYGIVLMMIAAGCSDPQRFAKRMLAEYATEAKKIEATK